MSDRITEYFKRFGNVNAVKLVQNEETFYGLMEFSTAEIAAAVLSNEVHCIDSCDVVATAAEPSHQLDYILNALADDHLREIISKLHQFDLTSAANVCNRFNQIARSIFSIKYRKLDLTQWSREQTLKSLHTFGALAQSIDLKVGNNHR